MHFNWFASSVHPGMSKILPRSNVLTRFRDKHPFLHLNPCVVKCTHSAQSHLWTCWQLCFCCMRALRTLTIARISHGACFYNQLHVIYDRFFAHIKPFFRRACDFILLACWVCLKSVWDTCPMSGRSTSCLTVSIVKSSIEIYRNVISLWQCLCADIPCCHATLVLITGSGRMSQQAGAIWNLCVLSENDWVSLNKATAFWGISLRSLWYSLECCLSAYQNFCSNPKVFAAFIRPLSDHVYSATLTSCTFRDCFHWYVVLWISHYWSMRNLW